MGDKFILDSDGNPQETDDLMAWGRWFETADRQVGLDVIGDSRVSTVFLGLDHSFGHGPPILYETLVFGGRLDDEGDRYETREQAAEGHAAIVARVRAVSNV